jgi:hypothetical protein
MSMVAEISVSGSVMQNGGMLIDMPNTVVPLPLDPVRSSTVLPFTFGIQPAGAPALECTPDAGAVTEPAPEQIKTAEPAYLTAFQVAKEDDDVRT